MTAARKKTTDTTITKKPLVEEPKLRRRGLVAAAAAFTAALASGASAPRVSASDGQTITVANSFSPTASTSLPTRLYNPSSTVLSPVLFKVDNYSNTLLTLPINTRFGIVGSVSGVDSGTGSGSKVGVYGAVDTGNGVMGNGGTGNGVYGFGSGATSNGGYFTGGYGIIAISSDTTSGVGGYFSGALAPIHLDAGSLSAAQLNTAGGHRAGDLYVTSDHLLCFFDGTSWQRVVTTSVTPSGPLPTNAPTATSAGPTSTPLPQPPTRASVPTPHVLPPSPRGTEPGGANDTPPVSPVAQPPRH